MGGMTEHWLELVQRVSKFRLKVERPKKLEFQGIHFNLI
jgi:hypothetical protein